MRTLAENRRHFGRNRPNSAGGRCARRPVRRAFTPVELLVVFAIIGTSIALLLPAVQSTGLTRRRVACQNNMRQIGISLLGFDCINKVFPASGWTTAGPANPTGRYVGWRTLILPYIEESKTRSGADRTRTDDI